MPKAGRAMPDPASLDDDALVAGIPEAGLALAPALAAEAARRGLLAAVPALERLCCRLVGFGRDREVPEQMAALDALARIGGAAAANAVLRILSKDVVLGQLSRLPLRLRFASVLSCQKARHCSFCATPTPLCGPMLAVALLFGPPPSLSSSSFWMISTPASPPRQPARWVAWAKWRQGPPCFTGCGKLRRQRSSTPFPRLPAMTRRSRRRHSAAGRIARSAGPLAGKAFDALAGIDNPRARRLVEILVMQGRTG